MKKLKFIAKVYMAITFEVFEGPKRFSVLKYPIMSSLCGKSLSVV